MTKALPVRSTPSCRSASRCRRPRCRTARSTSAPRHLPRRSRPVPVSQALQLSALPPAQARAWAIPWPHPWRPLGQHLGHARRMSPRTTPQQQPEMSVFATRTTGSLIIVTGRWPESASCRRGWIAGKCFFGKALTALPTAALEFPFEPRSSDFGNRYAGCGLSLSCGLRAAAATARRSIAADPQHRSCADASLRPALPSHH